MKSSRAHLLTKYGKGYKTVKSIASTLRMEGNAYEKVDQDRFMRFPKLHDIQSTSFLAVQDLTLMPPDEDNSMKIIDESDTMSILNKIKKENFRKKDL